MYEPLIAARLGWQDNTLWSADYEDIYHSKKGGPGQARHVFLAGNNLPAAWQDRARFVILETGFGSGLNFLATWSAWRQDAQACQQLHYIAVEKHPFGPADLARIHPSWPEFAELTKPLLEQWPLATPGFHRLAFDNHRVILTLAFGDALTTLPQLNGQVDAFYLDGFAPDKNPTLWSVPIFKQCARLAAPNATLATWCVAGNVRRALQEAGFKLEKTAGFDGKREMLRGHLIAARQRRKGHTPGQAIIIGAGLAGTSAASALARRGWKITLIDERNGPAQGASGNLAGIVRPILSRDDNLAARFTRAAFLHAMRFWPRLQQPPRSSSCGVIHIAENEADAAHQQAVIAALRLPDAFAGWLDANEISKRCGQSISQGGWHFPGAGWANPPSLCAAMLADGGNRIEFLAGQPVTALEPTEAGWRTLTENGSTLATGDIVVFAGGADHLDLMTAFTAAKFPIRRMRGQVTWLPADHLPGLDQVLCRDGYVIPPVDSVICTGASYDSHEDIRLNLATQRNNLIKLDEIIPGSSQGLNPETLDGRVGFRAIASDRLPLVGALPARLNGKIPGKVAQWPRQSGLYALLGLASRGLVWSTLCGELLASQVGGEPLPLEQRLVDAVDPARFAWRAHADSQHSHDKTV